MRFTDIKIIDPLMSIGVAIFIFINAIRNLKEVINLFLAKLPAYLRIDEIKEHICEIDGVEGVHHIHIWSMDGQSNYATMHVVCSGETQEIKRKIREELKEHGICHATIELEMPGEHCHEIECCPGEQSSGHHHHHHHH
jgi:cobalt-zinc-cadmium efflux system protein